MRHFPREDVLYVIVQYLREQKLYESAVCLLRESRIDCKWLCGPSKEIYLLREWIFTGQWQKARRLLEPLESTIGSKEEYEQMIHILSKYEALELVFNEKRVKLMEKKHGKNNVFEMRLNAYESIVPFLRGEIKEEDYEKKYLDMRKDQLIQIFDTLTQLKFDQAIAKSKRKSTKINPQSICIDIVSRELPLTHQQQQQQQSEDQDSGGETSSPLVLSPPGVLGDMDDTTVDSHLMDAFTVRDVKNPLRQSVAGFSITRVRRGSQLNDRLAKSMDFRTGIIKPKDLEVSESESEDEAMTCVSTQTDNVEAQCGEGSTCGPVHHGSGPIEKSNQEQTKPKEKETVVDISASSVMEKLFMRPPVVTEKLLEEPEEHTQVVDTSKSSSSCTRQVEEEEDMPPPPAHTDQVNGVRNHGGLSNSVSLSAPVEWDAAVLPPSKLGMASRKSTALNRSTNVSTSSLHPHHQIQQQQQQKTPVQITSYSQLNEETIGKLHVIAEAKEAQAIRAMDVSKSGKFVAVGTNARVLRLLDISSSLQQASVMSSSNFLRSSSSTNPVGSSMSGASGSISSLLPVVAEKYKHHTSSIYCVGWNSTDTLLATGAAESCIKVLPVNTSSFSSEDILDESRQLMLTQHEGKTREVQFTPELHRNLLMTAASGDQVLRFWDIDSGKIDISCIKLDGHMGEILCARFRGHSRVGDTSTPANSHQVLSCALDQTIRLWDLRSGCCEKMWTKMPSDPFSLGVSPVNDFYLASGHEDGHILLWDLRSSRPLGTFSSHEDEIRAISFSPDGKWLLSGSFDGTLSIMEIGMDHIISSKTIGCFSQHKDKVLQAQWHPTRPNILSSGADKIVKCWSFY